MISHEHRCIFVHINKCAGSSIDRVLGYRPPRHATIAEYRDRLDPAVFGSYYKFAFVRNPWDRIVSMYVHRRWRGNEDAAGMGFRQWVKHFHPRFLAGESVAPIANRLRLGPQWGWISIDGELAVDYVGRFETLQDDFARVCRTIGLEGVELPHEKNRSLRPHYSTYYDRETREMVAAWHRKDIEEFGYRFERPSRPVLLRDALLRRIRFRLRYRRRSQRSSARRRSNGPSMSTDLSGGISTGRQSAP